MTTLLRFALTAALAGGPSPLPPNVRCATPAETDGWQSTRTYQAFPQPNLVPWPRSITAESGYTALPITTAIIAVTDAALPAATLLAADLAVLTAGALNLTVGPNRARARAPPITITLGINPVQPGYSTLEVDHTGAVLSGRSHEALVAAATTLLQALEFSGDRDSVTPTKYNCTTRPAWRLPLLTIADGPEFGYRGLLVDAARSHVLPADLHRLVETCRFYKLNYLHVHMSDDQAFTFPSATFPELAARSAWRYTLEELAALKRYADQRGVEIVWEMDVPGHSGAAVKAMPDLFGFPSAPGLGIINFVNPAVVARLKTLFDEIDAVFRSPFLAMGGDEVSFDQLADLPEITAALKATNMTGVMDLYREFIAEMQRYAVEKNQTLRVWEGFAAADGQQGHKPANRSSVAIPTDGISVTIFDGVYYPPPRLAADGYRMINANTAALYVNEPTCVPELIYDWHPWLFGDLAYTGYESWWELPPAPGSNLRDMVDGVQICAWGMPGPAQINSMRSHAPAMSDRSWFPQALRSYPDFQKRYASTDAKLALLFNPPPPPPPPPPPHPPGPPPPPSGAYAPQHGACRDRGGDFTSPRLEHYSISFAACKAKCDALRSRCDAFDINGAVPAGNASLPVDAWCGVWGVGLTRKDAVTGFTFFCDGDCGKGQATPVCRGDPAAGETNTCFPKAPAC